MKLLNRHFLKYILNNFKRYYSEVVKNKNVTELLPHRTLLQLKGADTVELLQGLTTNDVTILSNNGVGSLYTLFLNIRGRVLFDGIIYKVPDADTYFLEVDKAVSTSIQKHLNIYRIRKDIKIENLSDKYNVWVHFNPALLSIDPKESMNLPYLNMRNGTDSALMLESDKGMVIEYFDPRTSLLGSRIIGAKTAIDTVTENYGHSDTEFYKMLRYRLGVGEGSSELPSGKCLPLETNCDYLNGISFNKGCYLGQELTARTYHTGVIRKRYMPVFFYSNNTNDIKDDVIKANDKNVGLLRGKQHDVGLGLLRISEVENKLLEVDGKIAFTVKPFWWPQDKMKEKGSIA